MCADNRRGGQVLGANGNGQLGDGTTTSTLSPPSAAVVGLASVLSVACGAATTCVVAAGGNAHCWGRNNEGQLGTGTTTNVLAPSGVAVVSDVKQIAPWDSHTCALQTNGDVRCWGYNGHLQLGLGATNTTSPLLSPSGVVLSNVASLSGGPLAMHTCAEMSSAVGGGQQCWDTTGIRSWAVVRRQGRQSRACRRRWLGMLALLPLPLGLMLGRTTLARSSASALVRPVAMCVAGVVTRKASWELVTLWR